MVGKIEAWRRKGQLRMRWMNGINDQWTWVWASSRSWWWTGNPGMLQSLGSQRVRHDWKTELNGWLYRENFDHKFFTYFKIGQKNMVQFSHSVVSYSLRPHELQHARLPCPSPTPGVHSNLCPSSRWWHPAISSSVVPFSSCPQSLPASESFPMSQFFAWGGQSIGVSALASYLNKTRKIKI